MSEVSTTPQRRAPTRWIRYFVEEIGLVTLFNAARDTKILCFQRFVRLFAYGASTLILATYLAELGISDEFIGLFMTLTLAGDVVISFFLTLIADSLGRRKILALGALLMAASGVVFALSGNYWVLLAAAILGVITPSGNEIGPFRAVEESTIAHLTPPDQRNHVIAWYTLIGTAGTALGLMTCGWATSLLQDKAHWSTIDAYRVVFIAYAVLGLFKFLLAVLLSAQCEANVQPKTANATETAPLLQGNNEINPKKPKKPSFLAALPHLSTETKVILVQLCILMAFDSFGSGLATMSWVTYYFKKHFNINEGQLGTFFFATSIVQAISILVAASIAKRIGNIKTMVFTHLPSAVCLAMIGIPSSLPLAMMFVVLRASTQSMDSGPRSAFLATILLPNERTAVMGTLNVVKTASQSLGPSVTGFLAGKDLFWVAFMAAGSLKAAYDIGMLLTFAGHKTREERALEDQAETANGRP